MEAKKKKKVIIWCSVAVVAIAAAIIIAKKDRSQVSFNTTVVNKGNIEITVMATGYIQPVEEVEVGTQVSGEIEKIYVDYNSHVTAGQLLAELDQSTLNEQLIQANASMNSAKSALLLAEQNYNRTKKLHDAKAATDVEMEEAVNQLTQAQMTYDNAKSNANQAKVNLEYAYIYSPINGIILDRAVSVGQTVASSFETPTLFTIAEDLTKMQVEADVDEADIGMVKVGQKAEFTVDAYSDEVFEGTVQQVRMQPTTTSNVVTYTVIIEAPNPEEKLFPGMTANITIMIESDSGLSVPVEAVNYVMTQEVADKIGYAGPLTAAETGQEGKSVWVLKDGKAELRPITTGIGDGIDYIVKSGLNEGDVVILSATTEKRKIGQAAKNPLMPSHPGSNKDKEKK